MCSSLINKRGGVVLVAVLVLVGAVIVVGVGGVVVVDTDLVYGVSQYGYCKHSCGKLACFRVRDASNNSFRSVNVVMTAIFAVVATTVAVVHTAATTDTAAFIRLERMRVPTYIPNRFVCQYQLETRIKEQRCTLERERARVGAGDRGKHAHTYTSLSRSCSTEVPPTWFSLRKTKSTLLLLLESLGAAAVLKRSVVKSNNWNSNICTRCTLLLCIAVNQDNSTFALMCDTSICGVCASST